MLKRITCNAQGNLDRRQNKKPRTEEKKIDRDVILSVMRHLGIRDVCAMACVSRTWHRYVKDVATTYWTKAASALTQRCFSTLREAQKFCIRATLHGYTSRLSAHRKAIMRILYKKSHMPLLMRMFGAFLKTVVCDLRIGQHPDYASVYVHTPRFAAAFRIFEPNRIVWRKEREAGTYYECILHVIEAGPWQSTTMDAIVEAYQNTADYHIVQSTGAKGWG